MYTHKIIMKFILVIFLAIASSHTEGERACYLLASKYFINQSLEIQEKINKQSSSDPLGTINKMIKDSFLKCNETITKEETLDVNSSIIKEIYYELVKTKIDDYISLEVEPNFEFIGYFKSIGESVERKKVEL